MKQIKINNLEENLFYEELSNKLGVYLVPLQNKNKYFISFFTKYGNHTTHFKIDGKEKTVPSGIAHFLEHKMFEREDEEIKPFQFFTESGTDVNAGTSIFYTTYYCSGNNKFYENLKYLLNWIPSIHVTDELVEKEKGIIIQESRMGEDNPDQVLYYKTVENVFINDTYKNKVIGTEEEINSINKEDVLTCYNSFYRPDNMYVVISGNFDPKEAIKIIREELKNFKNGKEKIEKIIEKEPNKVKKEYEELSMNVSIPRISVAYKISRDTLNLSILDLDNYLSVMNNCIFGNTSMFLEESLKKGLLTEYDFSNDISDKYIMLNISAITNKPDEMVKKIEDNINNIDILEEDFEREKKVAIARAIKTMDFSSAIVENIKTDIIYYGKYQTDIVNIIKEMKYSKLQELIKKIDFSNKAVIKILPKNSSKQ